MTARATAAGIEVVTAGALTTVQDLGRTGYAHLGVPTAGPVDRSAFTLANRLVGNASDAAGLEVTLTGCRLRFARTTIIAVTGAPVDRLRVGARGADLGVPVPVPAGAVVHLGRSVAGVRTYLAVAGGIAVPPVLGSRATDTLSGLGPPVLRDGDVLPVGAPTGQPATVWFTPPVPAPAGPVPLRIRPGPREDWFTAGALDTLTASTYTVGDLSNRVAARLNGPGLDRAVRGELPSEGVVLGAVQVPAGGQPLVFLADHPTTGGYPVIAVVDPDDLPGLAQCRPGAAVRFVRQE